VNTQRVSGFRVQASGDRKFSATGSRFRGPGDSPSIVRLPSARSPLPTPHFRLPSSRRGFTLIEVSLALLVISIGVLGAFALFPHGLAEARLASQETQAGLFAEMVLRTYRAASTVIPWDQLNTYEAPVPGAGVFWNGPGTTPRLRPGPSYRTFVNTTQLPDGGEVDEVALRYKLVIDDLLPGRVKRMTLYVLLGRFGITQDSDAQVYVSYIYNQQ